ncbi:hypothetical protein PanWU01x14_139950, partial [Parasponia andersonii]
ALKLYRKPLWAHCLFSSPMPCLGSSATYQRWRAADHCPCLRRSATWRSLQSRDCYFPFWRLQPPIPPSAAVEGRGLLSKA